MSSPGAEDSLGYTAMVKQEDVSFDVLSWRVNTFTSGKANLLGSELKVGTTWLSESLSEGLMSSGMEAESSTKSETVKSSSRADSMLSSRGAANSS